MKPRQWMLVAVAAVALLVGVVAGVLVGPEAVLGGARSFPTMPKAVYNLALSTTGGAVDGGVVGADLICDKGDVLLSGGLIGLDAGTTLESMIPNTDRAFVARWRPNGTDTVTLIALCADAPPAHKP